MAGKKKYGGNSLNIKLLIWFCNTFVDSNIKHKIQYLTEICSFEDDMGKNLSLFLLHPCCLFIISL